MTILELLEEQQQAREESVREVPSMTNAAYEQLCERRLEAEVREIVRHYQESANEAWKYSVR